MVGGRGCPGTAALGHVLDGRAVAEGEVYGVDGVIPGTGNQRADWNTEQRLGFANAEISSGIPIDVFFEVATVPGLDAGVMANPFVLQRSQMGYEEYGSRKVHCKECRNLPRPLTLAASADRVSAAISTHSTH